MKKIPGGLLLSELEPGSYGQDPAGNYSASKAGNWFLASEFDRRLRKEGIVSVTMSPGTLKTKGWDGAPWLKMLFTPLFYEPKFGAYTELWCGRSEDVKCEDGGKFAIPWGRWHPSPRQDILESLKSKEEGGTGLAAEFWDWCERETKAYAG